MEGSQASQDADGVAIVGTRSASPDGCSALALASNCWRGVTVVSGLASGIDTAAHLVPWMRTGEPLRVIGDQG